MVPTPPTPVDAEPAAVTDRLAGPRVAVPRSVLDRIAGSGAAVSTAPADRAAAGRDWWPVAIGWAARGQVAARPAAVVRPTTTEQVAATLAACSAAGVPVTPMAGRSGVCGGSVPASGGVSLDCTGLTGEVVVDEASLTADVPAGTFGPDLEAALRATGSGYTLGHWPQSMDLSTVGGWLACRSAGQASTRYGKIEDMVAGLRVVLADGRVIDTEGRGPRAATGPSLTQLFVGSEGTLGVMTSARLRVHPVPPAEGRRAYGFPSFAAGLDACRRVLRRGATPAVLRLYDEAESGRHFDRGDTCVLVVLDEADRHLLDATLAVVDEECRAHGEGGVPGARLGDDLVEHWLARRNDVSALAPLWRAGVVVDTAEVAGRWAVLPDLARSVVAALAAVEGTLVASVHQSHAYPDGACLYFTFAGRRSDGERGGAAGGGAAGGGGAPSPGIGSTAGGGAAGGGGAPGPRIGSTAGGGAAPDPGAGDLAWEEAYYRRAWDAVTGTVLRHGAAISHHHGIGLQRARFLPEALGTGFEVLTAVKRALDPAGVLNPGKLGLPSPFGEVAWP